MSPVVIGSAGVGLLLLAFVLNLARAVTERSPIYLLMNITGSGLAAWYAWVGGVIPFVILELFWGVTAGARLVMIYAKGSRS
jgi:hypothetical protein